MKLPIIMAAVGTTTRAVATYTHLDRSIREHFPEAELFWAYSSKKISRTPDGHEKSPALRPEQVLYQLAEQGKARALVQSLHLFAGIEFHSLVPLAVQSPLDCAIGMPLLTSPQDFDQLGEILRPVVSGRPEKAILFLGHGTTHPVWTAYYGLEKILRKKFGERIYVGVVEKYPDSTHLVDEIADHGYAEVCIIPLFLVAGVHYRRDIVGDSPTSWQSRLQARKIAVECIDHGLGLYPGFEKIILRHIREAEATIT